jgi:hypothetical protein
MEIAEHGDPRALEEFHHRRLFRGPDGQPLRFVDFVTVLRDEHGVVGLGGVVLDLAYDLTIDKFTNLPGNTDAPANGRRAGADCRKHFAGLLRRVMSHRDAEPGLSPVEYETAIAGIVQRDVAWQFQLSCRDALRKSSSVRTRYAWSVDGGTIYVWLPARMPGRKRRAWLEAHVPDPDPARLGEQARVQAIVDGWNGVPRVVRLSRRLARRGGRGLTVQPQPSAMEHEIGTHGLAMAVAEEKAQGIHEQRRAIWGLGGLQLKKLVLRIFAELGEDRYDEKKLAEDFGLSRATVSRFAGSEWRRLPGSKVPDLWINVARTLASHSAFVSAAQEAGVWPRVVQVLEKQHTAN